MFVALLSDAVVAEMSWTPLAFSPFSFLFYFFFPGKLRSELVLFHSQLCLPLNYQLFALSKDGSLLHIFMQITKQLWGVVSGDL